MKRLLYILLLCTLNFVLKAQTTYPITQNIGSPVTLVQVPANGGLKAVIVPQIFADTTAANAVSYVKYTAGAIIRTTDDRIWRRNEAKTAWIEGSGSVDITSFNFYTDSSLIICYSNGVCDTISITNLTTIINNVVQNFNDSLIYNLNDSTLIICNSAGSCDTISLGNSNTYYFLNDSTLITCDTTEVICIGDSCYQQQLCDTIPIPDIVPIIYQNGVRKSGNIVEWGVADEGDNTSYIYHNTFIKTGGTQINFTGGPVGLPLFNVKNTQWVQLTPYIMSFEHDGAYHPGWGLLDSANDVQLNINYTDPFYIPTLGTLAGDTIGYMGNRYGYMIAGNLPVKSNSAKQAGIFIDTFSPNDEGVTIFANQIPQNFYFYHIDSTFLDKRVAVFHTDQSTNFLGKVYLTNGRLEPDTAQITASNNLTLGNGNVFLVSGNTQINAITTSGWQAGSAPIHLVFSGTPTVKNNTAGGAGTATILLAGRTDFTAATGDVLSLLYDGTNWYETNRALAGSSGIGTANNGLIDSSGTVQLGDVSAPGSKFYANRYINGQSFGLFLNSSSSTVSSLDISNNSIGAGSILNISSTSTAAASNLQKGLNISLAGVNITGGQTTYGGYISNTHSGTSTNYGLYSIATGGSATYGVYGEITSAAGAGVQGIATSGTAVGGGASSGNGGVFTSTSGLGAQISSAGTYAIDMIRYGTTTNDIIVAIKSQRQTTGTAADGIGHSFDMYNEDASGTINISNQLISKWTTAANATRTSQLDITGVNSAATGTIASFYGSGVVGIGISSSYTATRLNIVDNAVGAASIVDITSTSTAAASNLQKGVNVSLSGANGTAGQTSYGIYVSNTHTGSVPTNIGVYGTANSGTANKGVYGLGGNTAGSIGVQGESSSTSGIGILGTANGSTAFGVKGTTDNNGGAALAGEVGLTSLTTGRALVLSAYNGSGAGGTALGASITWSLESTTAQRDAGGLIMTWTNGTDATRSTQLLVTGIGSATTNNIISFEGNQRTMLYGRLEMQQGADVASVAGAIAVGLDGNVFELTGTNAVTLISNLNFVNGSVIYLVFTSTATLTDGTANSGTDIGMELAGGANFTGSADDVVVLVLSEMGGTQRWREVSRSVN